MIRFQKKLRTHLLKLNTLKLFLFLGVASYGIIAKAQWLWLLILCLLAAANIIKIGDYNQAAKALILTKRHKYQTKEKKVNLKAFELTMLGCQLAFLKVLPINWKSFYEINSVHVGNWFYGIVFTCFLIILLVLFTESIVMALYNQKAQAE